MIRFLNSRFACPYYYFFYTCLYGVEKHRVQIGSDSDNKNSKTDCVYKHKVVYWITNMHRLLHANII